MNKHSMRLLIVGYGDIATRIVAQLQSLPVPIRLYGLVRTAARCGSLREAGVVPILADLDQRRSLNGLAGLADVVLHLAPPAESGETDTRTRKLLAALSRGRLPRRLIYISTSGVYGDRDGARLTEAAPVNPRNARAKRRLDAERQIRAWAQRHHVSASVLRVPGIYAAERLPVARLQAGTPAIEAGADSHTNHIHADDLAAIVRAALRHGRPNRLYHASDDSELKMGDYFDAVAEALGYARPPRLARHIVQQQVSASLWSFMNESRRLSNERMKRELHVKLRYPTVSSLLQEMRQGKDRGVQESLS